MGGSDTDDNKIWLTVQEHYWAHKLLCQEHEDNPDLIKSFNLVLHRLGYGIITQEDIDFINKILKVTLPSGVQKIEETLIE